MNEQTLAVGVTVALVMFWSIVISYISFEVINRHSK
jgi:hypothetical protein